MKKIFTIILDNNKVEDVYIDTSFITEYQVTYVEINFIKYIIQRQFEMIGLHDFDFMELEMEQLMKALNCKRVTIMNAFKKFRRANIIYQFKFRCPEWKLNIDTCNVVKVNNI